MYELVISGGDSFTFGAELDTDNSVNPSPNSWANLVAQRIGKNHINVARSGRSNSYIVRHVLHELQKAFEQNISSKKIFVQVMWTFADRHEFAIGIPTGEYDSPWMYLTPYSHVDETESEWFRNVDRSLPTWQSVYNSLKSFYNKNKQLGIVDFAKQYSKLIQSTPDNDSYTSVKELLLLQNTLEIYNISYVFTYVNQYVANGLFDDSDNNIYLKSARKLLNRKKWYSFPGNFQKYTGFDDWAKHNRYEYATSHPLENAHRDAAELIYKHIQSIT
jgi:hypothetical protein